MSRPTRLAHMGALTGTSALATLLVAGLADSAGEHDGLATLDPEVAGQVLHVRTPALTAVAQAFTFVGSEAVVGVVAVLVLVVLLLRRQVYPAAMLALSLGGSALLTVLVKLLVARPRPGAVDRLGPDDATFSFPSGHTLNSTVLIAVLVWLLWTRTGVPRAPVALGAAALALGVGASRVYLGYHWTTDVIASGLVAVAWLALVCLLSRPVAAVLVRRPAREDGTPDRGSPGLG